MNIAGTAEQGQVDDAKNGTDCPDLLEDLFLAQIGQINVQEQNVSLQVLHLIEELFACRRSTYNLYAVLFAQKQGQSFQVDLMIIGNKNSNHGILVDSVSVSTT